METVKDKKTSNKTTNEIDEVTDEGKKEGFLTPERVKKEIVKEEFEPEEADKN